MPPFVEVRVMQDWVQKLLVLQEKDLRIDKLEEQLAAAPAERAKVDRLVDEAKAGEAAAKGRCQDEAKQLKSLEVEAETVRARMREFQAKSAMIKNNEEYRAALHQIEACSQQVRDAEDRELALMEQMEASRAAWEKARKDREAAETRAAEMRADLDLRERNCRDQLEAARADRQQAAALVPPDTASRYERIRRQVKRNWTDRRHFVPIKDNVCDRCHMNVTAQARMNARKATLVSCENCGALLYWEE